MAIGQENPPKIWWLQNKNNLYDESYPKSSWKINEMVKSTELLCGMGRRGFSKSVGLKPSSQGLVYSWHSIMATQPLHGPQLDLLPSSDWEFTP